MKRRAESSVLEAALQDGLGGRPHDPRIFEELGAVSWQKLVFYIKIYVFYPNWALVFLHLKNSNLYYK